MVRSAMAQRFQHNEDDAIVEILRRALDKTEVSDQTLQQRLFATADEMGVSREAVLAAEEEYRLEQEQRQKLARSRSIQRKAFGAHFCVYVCVNLMLAGINVLTYHDDPELWFLYPLIAWGMAVLLHAMVAFDPFDFFGTKPNTDRP